jgi:hypothetical protein
MPLVRLFGDRIEPIPPTTFAAQGLRERADLQRLLKEAIHVVAPDVLVIAEEFGDFEDSHRRIDLLGVDRQANLVVIELKRDDSSHMELQAIRYAAMVSALGFDRVADLLASRLASTEGQAGARSDLLTFLGANGEEEPAIADVRIVLVSAHFSKELTTSVLWLNERGLDIRCIRLTPYRVGDLLLADVEQVIPLKEAEDYLVQLREKRREQRESARGGTMEQFWGELPPPLHPVARELLAWLEPRFTYIWPGRGSCVPVVRIEGTKHHLFRIRTDGEVGVYFDWMSRQPPFDREPLRREMRDRLNAVEGVEIPEDSLRRRPRFSLRTLEKSDSMQKMQQAIDWWLSEVQRFHEAGGPDRYAP